MTVFRQSKLLGIAAASLALRLVLNETGQAQDFTYTNINGTITITGYTGPGGAVTIPSTIDGLSVTTIGNRVFLNLTDLTSVSLPESLASIEDWAFAGCGGLTTITLPNRLIVVGPYAFWSCSNLTSITIGNNVAYISDSAFSGCSGPDQTHDPRQRYQHPGRSGRPRRRLRWRLLGLH